MYNINMCIHVHVVNQTCSESLHCQVLFSVYLHSAPPFSHLSCKHCHHYMVETASQQTRSPLRGGDSITTNTVTITWWRQHHNKHGHHYMVETASQQTRSPLHGGDSITTNLYYIRQLSVDYHRIERSSKHTRLLSLPAVFPAPSTLTSPPAVPVPET